MDGQKQNLEESIRSRAESYTPEWRFDMENPDIGSALAIAFEEMASGTVKRFSQIPLKNRIAFLNSLNVRLLPAVPSYGYVQFALINEEVDGSMVEAGTLASASDSSLPDGRILFETQEEVFASPARISDIYQASDRCDTIFQLYDRQEGEWEPVSLFLAEGNNLQAHEMYISHNDLLGIHSEADIEMKCFRQAGIPIGLDKREALADREKAVFEYYCGQGWIPFESQKITGEGLEFHKGKGQPEFLKREIEGNEGYWIRCRVLDFSALSQMHFGKLLLSSRNQEMVPDTVFGAMEERDRYRCLPFGDRPGLYEEVYFGSEEVLSKRGAQVTFSFHIQFEKVPLDEGGREAFQWEWIMKQSDFRQEKEYDITIESVIWEYYNGTGWTKLFPEERDNKSGRFFSGTGEAGGFYRTLKFTCPEDIEKTLVNAAETYYIRARIDKMNNLYKLTGNYIVPRLENISFRYSYQDVSKEPQKYIFYNNLEYRCLESRDLKNKSLFPPFYQTGMEEMGIYFGFEAPLAGSPVKILFCFAGERECRGQRFFWEYWDGRGWKNTNPIDGTDYFSRTGLVTFSGNMEMGKKRMFGRERYWLRIRADGWKQEFSIEQPLLQKICMNAVPVRSIYRREREYFQMEAYQEDNSFELLEGNIFDMQVYVDEEGYLSESEIQKLGQEDAVFSQMDADGEREGMWVKWKQVPDFSESGSSDRHYVLDEAEGILLFGDGKHGRIPYPSKLENIFAEYCSGGGEHTNLQAGKIDTLGVSAGYISEVSNPLPMMGGCDMETREEAVRRASAAIRHQGRAVSARDYEELAMCSSRDIQMVKCFAGYDDRALPLSGAVTLVVLQKQFRQGQVQFMALKRTLLEYMKNRIGTVLSDNRRFFIVQPDLIEIRLRIELSMEDFGRAFQVKNEVLQRLGQFLSPGSQKSETGWKIGQFPNVMQIKNALGSIHGIACIHNIMMGAYAVGSGEESEVDIEAVRSGRYVLPVNGEHEIIILT